MSTALIDADVLTYMVGFAAQTTLWEVRDDGVCVFASIKKNECLTFLEDSGSNLEIVGVVIPDKIENALHTVKVMIKKITTGAGCNRSRCYLTGKDNFRDRIATLAKYKGNRDKLTKPYHYENIRQYLVTRHNAIVVDGMEADDAIAIVHTRAMREKRRTVICSIDKDFNQIVGPHYYFKKDAEEYYEISPDEARYNFWAQVLTGDSTDNIPGIKGCGPVKAGKILDAVSPGEYCGAVLAAYKAAYGESHKYYHWNDANQENLIDRTPGEVMIENARLIYLLRERPEHNQIQLWNPKWLDSSEKIALNPKLITGGIDQD